MIDYLPGFCVGGPQYKYISHVEFEATAFAETIDRRARLCRHGLASNLAGRPFAYLQAMYVPVSRCSVLGPMRLLQGQVSKVAWRKNEVLAKHERCSSRPPSLLSHAHSLPRASFNSTL